MTVSAEASVCLWIDRRLLGAVLNHPADQAARLKVLLRLAWQSKGRRRAAPPSCGFLLLRSVCRPEGSSRMDGGLAGSRLRRPHGWMTIGAGPESASGGRSHTAKELSLGHGGAEKMNSQTLPHQPG